MRRTSSLILGLGLTLLAVPAMAHTGHGVGGVVAGFAHPLLGLDHLLAMICIGVLGASLGGRAIWALPASFVAAMIVGAILGMGGIGLPWVETGIALSLVVLGLALAARVKLPTLVSALGVAVFAVFHGHAHGAEIPAAVSGLLYAGGFVTATVLLHALGIAATSVVETRGAQIAMRAGGAAVAGFGLLTLVG